MIRLRVLGASDLRGADDAAIDTVLAQPKGFALLAYLAVAAPHGFHRRDVLLALLWPELDQTRARNALSQALHRLRRELGPGAITVRGDDEVALADAAVWCDVRAFDRAIAAGKLDEAVSLYGGDLLPGFFVSTAPEFARWLDDQRIGRKARAAEAAWALADDAASRGNARAATAHAHWAAALVPDDEGALGRLIALLDRLGDRSGALRAYDAFARRLEAEYQVEPSAETQRLIRSVRERSIGSPDARASRDMRPASAALQSALPRAASEVAAAPRTTRRLFRRPASAAAVAALVLLASAALAIGIRARRRPAAAAAPSIAVLPFLDLSPAHDDEYLSDGIAEELSDALSRAGDLRVTSRTSAFAFKNKFTDARAIGRALGAAALVEGSVRRDGATLRLTVQLIDAETGYHRWSRTYERNLADVLAVEDEIARSIADELRVELGANGAPGRSLAAHATRSVDAYRLYLQGRYFWNRRTAEAIERAIGYFQQAIAADSAYASAYAGLADCYNVLAGQTYSSPAITFPKAKAAALRALALDSTLVEAHVALAFADLFGEWNGSGARRELDRAVSLDPGYASARLYRAFYFLAIGRPADAVTEARHAQALDPLSLIINARVGFMLVMAHRFDDAIVAERHTLELDSTYAPAYWSLGDAYAFEHRFDVADSEFTRARAYSGLALGDIGFAYGLAGDRGAARQFLRQMNERSRTTYVDPYDRALVFAGLGDRDSALRWLEVGWQQRSSQLIWLRSEPMLDGLRADKRFDELVRKVGL
jgi:TolB-like protein/DNA-binding SARP family transcriptional activator/Tfp pilus assembly protein PilF